MSYLTLPPPYVTLSFIYPPHLYLFSIIFIVFLLNNNLQHFATGQGIIFPQTDAVFQRTAKQISPHSCCGNIRTSSFFYSGHMSFVLIDASTLFLPQLSNSARFGLTFPPFPRNIPLKINTEPANASEVQIENDSRFYGIRL
jgi:hypothetical protein